jgi:eukaryotic-like serine/threonine-protein kinase
MASVRPSGPATAVSRRDLPAAERLVQPVHPGDVLSERYQLEHQVGEGGMGTVWVANDLQLRRRVAVKLLAAGLVHDPEVMERFEREARLTASLDHPHIVPVYDVGRVAERPYIVMKLLEGDTLAGVLKQKGGLTAVETVALVRQVAAGLDYLHARNFIHRDIKAGNIFVAPDGQATILDFGILRARTPDKGLTRTGMVMGTPHYMAPEQALGLRDVDHRVDLYALAVVLFECLSGTLPFEADSELKLIQLQAHAAPPDLLDRAPWVPAAVGKMMTRALAKRPEERFGSGAELVAALEEAYGGATPVAVRPAPSAPRVSPQTAFSQRRAASQPAVGLRRWPALLALAVVGGALFAGVWGFRGDLPDAQQTQDAGVVVAEVFASLDASADVEDEVDAGLVLEVEIDAGATVLAVAIDAGAKVYDTGTPKRRGRLNVITTHAGEPYWAQVSLDGVPKGRTPLLLEVSPGLHQVRVERAGFRVLERAVRIQPGRPAVVRVELLSQ